MLRLISAHSQTRYKPEIPALSGGGSRIQPNILYSRVLGQDASGCHRRPSNYKHRLPPLADSSGRRAPYLDAPALCPCFHNPLNPVPIAAIMTPAGSCLFMHLSVPLRAVTTKSGLRRQNQTGNWGHRGRKDSWDRAFLGVDAVGRNKVLGAGRNAPGLGRHLRPSARSYLGSCGYGGRCPVAASGRAEARRRS